jgi:hypothetical protein
LIPCPSRRRRPPIQSPPKLRLSSRVFPRPRPARHEPGTAQEQPGGELAPGGEATRTEDAALQVGWVSTALPLRSIRCPQHLRPPPYRPSMRAHDRHGFGNILPLLAGSHTVIEMHLVQIGIYPKSSDAFAVLPPLRRFDGRRCRVGGSEGTRTGARRLRLHARSFGDNSSERVALQGVLSQIHPPSNWSKMAREKQPDLFREPSADLFGDDGPVT